MTRVTQENPAFTILLGDNVYTVGSHVESDARFDPTLVPEATAWIAGSIDYVSFGNHDAGTSSGLPSEHNFAVPVPVAGVTAPAQPPASERPEHNYSFDYGDVHFVTFDTNSLSNASRLSGQLAWVEADLQASTATWNIVFGHHPVAGAPDKPESPSDNYYQQVIPRLRTAGADLFMVGHSHTASASYPLLGESGGQATFVLDPDADFAKGAGVVQVVSGVGGRSLRSGSFTQFSFVRTGFSTSTSPAVEYGFHRVDVTGEALTISFVAADDGAVLDQFTISAPAPNDPTVTITASDASAAEPNDPGEFTVARSEQSSDPLTVTYAVGGSASPGSDYQTLPGTVTIPGGQTSAPVSVTIVNDLEPEGDEHLELVIQQAAGYDVGSPDRATVAIADDDSEPPVDTESPDATVTAPTPNQVFPAGQVTFTGNATDNVGVAQTLIAIRSLDLQQWWTGSGWGGWTTFQTILGAPNATATTWTHDWTPPADGRYAIWIRADDTSGNQDPTKPWITFNVGT
jgi:hypothetical protein